MEVSIVSNTHGRQGVTLLVIYPHPDDASIATGSQLASDRTRSVRTGMVICTGGAERGRASILTSTQEPRGRACARSGHMRSAILVREAPRR
jgi:LmbE family N-acetylglucosaminyl deacetylase